jgi:DNA-binding SARP family transcriptional activator
MGGAKFRIGLLRAWDAWHEQKWEEVLQWTEEIAGDKGDDSGENRRSWPVHDDREIWWLTMADSLALQAALLEDGRIQAGCAERIRDFAADEPSLSGVEERFFREFTLWIWHSLTGNEEEADEKRLAVEALLAACAPSWCLRAWRVGAERVRGRGGRPIPATIVLKRGSGESSSRTPALTKASNQKPAVTESLDTKPLTPRRSAAGTAPQDRAGSRPMWRIDWFFGLRFVCGERELLDIPWKRKKALELFLYLLSRPHYAAAREWVMEALFGDEEPPKAMNRLYVSAHRLKQVLSQHFGIEDGVVFRDGMVRLGESFVEWVDVEKYAALSRVGDQLWSADRPLAVEMYEEAVQMYGPILPEYPYMDWLNEMRTMLAERQSVMLARLGAYWTALGDFDRAVHCCRMRIEADPAREEAYQEMLRVLMAAGRTSEARTWSERLAEMCRREWGTEPSAELKRLVKG